MAILMRSLRETDCRDKAVLLRVDINAPIDRQTKRIVSLDRLRKSVPTIRYLLDHGARLAIIAHQGDTLDYPNLINLSEHAAVLSRLLGQSITYLDDVCGIAACAAVSQLQAGEAILLGNLRYLTEEVSGFEKDVQWRAPEMTQCWLIRRLAPLFDLYVNDAFAAAHRNAPSMVGFQEVLPTAAGFLLYDEYATLRSLLEQPRHPAVFVLGGQKISDAFGMMEQVLERSVADRILTCGVTGEIFLLAAGVHLGRRQEQWLAERDLTGFVGVARKLLERWPDLIRLPEDLATEVDGKRQVIAVSAEQRQGSEDARLPMDDALFLDIGPRTIEAYCEEISGAASIFANGPAGAYEQDLFAAGTARIWQAIAQAPGFTVIGGGDTIRAAERFTTLDDFNYVCTGGGAMVRFVSGDQLPLIEAMEKAYRRDVPRPC